LENLTSNPIAQALIQCPVYLEAAKCTKEALSGVSRNSTKSSILKEVTIVDDELMIASLKCSSAVEVDAIIFVDRGVVK